MWNGYLKTLCDLKRETGTLGVPRCHHPATKPRAASVAGREKRARAAEEEAQSSWFENKVEVDVLGKSEAGPKLQGVPKAGRKG